MASATAQQLSLCRENKRFDGNVLEYYPSLMGQNESLVADCTR
jgi:hypothetical protein